MIDAEKALRDGDPRRVAKLREGAIPLDEFKAIMRAGPQVSDLSPPQRYSAAHLPSGPARAGLAAADPPYAQRQGNGKGTARGKGTASRRVSSECGVGGCPACSLAHMEDRWTIQASGLLDWHMEDVDDDVGLPRERNEEAARPAVHKVEHIDLD